MELNKLLRPDLWKAIEAHYEKEDYTESLRDAMFLITELVQELSGLYDMDGTALMRKAFINKGTPEILITKNETQTEKDIQEGVGHILAGLSLAVRNPISHEKTHYTEQDAQSILLYINYLLNLIDTSKGKTKIDDWMDLLYDKDFTSTKRYAETLFKELPAKKRFEVLLQIFKNRHVFENNKINHFANILFNELTPIEKKEFISIVNKDLQLCKDNQELRSFLNIFAPIIYQDLDELCKLRIEDLVKHSIISGVYAPLKGICGDLATWIPNILPKFETKEEIIDVLIEKLNGSTEEEDYVFQFFQNIIFDSDLPLTNKLIKTIQNGLEEAWNRELYIDALTPIIQSEDDSQWKNEFEDIYIKAKEQLKFDDLDVPF